MNSSITRIEAINLLNEFRGSLHFKNNKYVGTVPQTNRERRI